jgi:periplasmic protein TonB
MTNLLEGADQLEREIGPSSDPIAGPAAGSLLLHGVMFGGLIFYGILNGFFHHNPWGNPGAGGAIQVTLVSNALPLPADQQNQNVLSTETPSQAPAEPTPKAKEAVDETAIPIEGKQAKPEKQAKNVPKTQPHQPPPKQDYRAQFGEQSGSAMARSTMAQTPTADAPVSIANGDFGTRFPWYVDGIKRKVKQNWDAAQVDPRTPKGAAVQIYFRVNRQGVPSSFRISTASGSPTLDHSCLLATERVDTFGDLPRESNDQYLDVTYDCTY